jgi:hypothetical protein
MYLCLLHTPAKTQPAMFAVRAFSVELGRIMQNVKDPQIGTMKLQ